MTDVTELVTRARAGDDAAWRQIVVRYRPYLWAVGRSFRLPDDEIADAVQDTWMSAIRSVADLRDPAKLGSWLGTIMRRRCGRLIRNQVKRPDQLSARDLPDVADDADVEHDVMAAERSRIVRTAVSMLPERDREVLRQLTADGTNYDLAARVLRMPRGSLGPTRSRILRRLRLLVEQQSGGDYLRSA